LAGKGMMKKATDMMASQQLKEKRVPETAKEYNRFTMDLVEIEEPQLPEPLVLSYLRRVREKRGQHLEEQQSGLVQGPQKE